jgi:hypothetical protein
VRLSRCGSRARSQVLRRRTDDATAAAMSRCAFTPGSAVVAPGAWHASYMLNHEVVLLPQNASERVRMRRFAKTANSAKLLIVKAFRANRKKAARASQPGRRGFESHRPLCYLLARQILTNALEVCRIGSRFFCVQSCVKGGARFGWNRLAERHCELEKADSPKLLQLAANPEAGIRFTARPGRRSCALATTCRASAHAHPGPR